MDKYKVLSAFEFFGQKFEAGVVVEMDQEVAKELLEKGTVKKWEDWEKDEQKKLAAQFTGQGIRTVREKCVDDSKFGFKGLGEFASVVKVASYPGGAVDERLRAIEVATKAASGISEADDTSAGFLVAPEFANGIWQRVQQSPYNLIATLDSYQVSGNTLKLFAEDETSRATGSRHGGVRGYWIPEAGQFTASAPKFHPMQVTLHKLGVFAYATEEMLADQSFLGPYLTRCAGDEIRFLVEDALFRGNGAGQPLGFLNHGATVSVAKETGQEAKTFKYENAIKMYSRVHAASLNKAVWLTNQDVMPAMMTMTINVGTGGAPVWMPAGGISGSPFNQLIGRPVIPTEYNPTLGTVGDVSFVDMSQYLFLMKKGAQVNSQMSIHLRFDYDEVAFKWTFRCAGQPLWKTALTPYQGTNTVSPWVTLATRA